MAHRKPTRSRTAHLHKVNFFVERGLFEDFREAAEADEESNVSVELRRLMRERVAEHRAEREGTAA